MAPQESTTCLSAPLYVKAAWLRRKHQEDAARWLSSHGLPPACEEDPWLYVNKAQLVAALHDAIRGEGVADDARQWPQAFACTSGAKLWAPVLRGCTSIHALWDTLIRLKLLNAVVDERGQRRYAASFRLDDSSGALLSNYMLELCVTAARLYGFDSVTLRLSADAKEVDVHWAAEHWFRWLGPLRPLFSVVEDRIASRRALANRARVFEEVLSDLGDKQTRIVGGKYQLVGTLGAGSSAVVYDAIRKDNGERVAVKVLRVASSDDGVMADRLRREGDALGLAASPHVVQLIDRGETDGGKPFLVLQYLGGCTLRQYVTDKGPLSAAQIAHVAEAMLGAARALHAAGVAHRDLSPGNVVLSESTPPQVTVVDFGVAQIEWEETRLTAMGTAVGTPGFVAPELSDGSKASVQSDLYSIGATLHFAGTGAAPEPGSYDRVKAADAWDVFFKGLLCTDPTKRFANAADALAALPRNNG